MSLHPIQITDEILKNLADMTGENVTIVVTPAKNSKNLPRVSVQSGDQFADVSNLLDGITGLAFQATARHILDAFRAVAQQHGDTPT